MICPKCNKEIGKDLKNCPHCNANLSFSTNIRSEEDNQQLDTLQKNYGAIQKVYNIIFKIYVIIILAITILLVLKLGGLSFLKSLFSSNRFSKILGSVLKGMLVTVAVDLIIRRILKFVKERFKSLKVLFIMSKIYNIMCKSIIMVILTIMPLLILISLLSSNRFSKAEYIELGPEKIPSLYSVVGQRHVLMSISEEDEMDKGFNISMDCIGIMYTNITQDDKNKYEQALIDYGFSKKNIYSADENQYHELLLKNNKDNTFYVVTINDLLIMYSLSDGTYEDVLKIENK